MAWTTLLVRLLQPSHATPPSMIKTFVISLFLVTGSLLSGCGSGEESGDLARYALQDGSGLYSASPTGSAFASLEWDPVGGVMGYFIHYGTQSPGSSGSCSYAQSMFSSTPTAMVTGLAENTTYYFAVSSFNGLESDCSAEVAYVPQSV